MCYGRKKKKPNAPKCKKIENGTNFESANSDVYVIPRSTFILASILVRRNEARCLARLIPIIHLTDCASSNDV